MLCSRPVMSIARKKRSEASTTVGPASAAQRSIAPNATSARSAGVPTNVSAVAARATEGAASGIITASCDGRCKMPSAWK